MSEEELEKLGREQEKQHDRRQQVKKLRRQFRSDKREAYESFNHYTPDASPPPDRIPPLQTLCHVELQGIAEAVSQQAVRTFANGLLTRQSPSKIAREVQAIIDKVGKTRSDMLVSFIVVRAFSVATLDSFRASGVTHVGTVAERAGASTALPSVLARDAKKTVFPSRRVTRAENKLRRKYAGARVDVQTAEDDRVCPECEEISASGPYTLDEAEGLIPAHPRCRCSFVPADASVHDADFDEDKHPRDARGRWTQGSTQEVHETNFVTSIAGFERAKTNKSIIRRLIPALYVHKKGGEYDEETGKIIIGHRGDWHADVAKRHGFGFISKSEKFTPGFVDPKTKDFYVRGGGLDANELASLQGIKTAHDSATHIAAGVMFLDPDGRALFVRRSSTGDHAGEWCFPGGAVEPGETVAQAAAREAHEEVGLRVRASALEQVDRRELDGVDFTTYVAHVPVAHELTLNDEHTDLVWRRLDDPPQPLHPGVRATVDSAVLGDEFNEELHPRDKTGKFTTSAVGPDAHAENLKAVLTNATVPHIAEPSALGGHVFTVSAHDVPSVKALAEAYSVPIFSEYPDKVNPAQTKLHIPEKVHPDLESAFDQPAHIDMKDLTKVAGKLGSNEGGVYEGADHSDPYNKTTQYYIKTPPTKDHVQNELTAAALYKLAGVNTMEYVPVKGGDHVATVLQTLDKNNVAHFSADERHEAQRDFAVHAWLANHDAVGTGGDNQVIVGGKVTTVDTGGSLKYRAQGEPKSSFGNTVHEISSLRDSSVNPDAAALYGNMTNAQIKESIARVTSISDQQIKDVVAANMTHETTAGVKELSDKLIARKNDLAAQAAKMTTPHPLATAIAQHEAALQTSQSPVFKTKMEHAKHLLMKGTTSEELKKSLNWPAIGVPKTAADLNLKLEKTKQGGVFFYKGTPMTPAEITAAKGMKFGMAAAAAPSTSAFDPVHPSFTEAPKAVNATSSATQAELDKAKKNTKLTAQYVPGAPTDHPEAEKLIAAFNAKWEGKDVGAHQHLLEQKVDEFKKLQSDMIPLMSESQKTQAAAAIVAKAEQDAKVAKQLKAAADLKAAEEAKLNDPVTKAHYDVLKGIGLGKGDVVSESFIKKHKLDISPEQGAYIRAYVGSHYSHLNDQLRNGILTLEQTKYAKALDKALGKMPAYEGYTQRGIGDDSGKIFERYASALGKTVVEPQFTSAGVSHKIWGDLTLHIEGKTGADIRSFNPGEGGGEIVYRPGTHFHVTKVDKKSKQVWMEEI